MVLTVVLVTVVSGKLKMTYTMMDQNKYEMVVRFVTIEHDLGALPLKRANPTKRRSIMLEFVSTKSSTYKLKLSTLYLILYT